MDLTNNNGHLNCFRNMQSLAHDFRLLIMPPCKFVCNLHVRAMLKKITLFNHMLISVYTTRDVRSTNFPLLYNGLSLSNITYKGYAIRLLYCVKSHAIKLNTYLLRYVLGIIVQGCIYYWYTLHVLTNIDQVLIMCKIMKLMLGLKCPA